MAGSRFPVGGWVLVSSAVIVDGWVQVSSAVIVDGQIQVSDAPPPPSNFHCVFPISLQLV